MKINTLLIIICTAFTILSCNNKVQTPKPHGFLRIDVPEHNYVEYNNHETFKFLRSTASTIEKDNEYDSQKYWINIVYPSLNAKIHLSYKRINNNFRNLCDDSHKIAYKHYIKAEAIKEVEYQNPKNNVYGILYQIKGNTASSVQFFATDSTKHFLRGSLYFNCKPNKDSLRPLIKYINKDIQVLVESIKWE
ncbi:MAG: gliding motility lipoprotein GldD [Marinifilaceae bacterium]|jgi:gliding motility-associated lipoprotein GldD|nr:gliding motility lipoprotein GldD [Marinilabiliaceae bacterium JC040]MCT4599685.1 gliding motility lipoprotein GldD [Marinifilaceae bacterium]